LSVEDPAVARTIIAKYLNDSKYNAVQEAARLWGRYVNNSRIISLANYEDDFVKIDRYGFITVKEDFIRNLLIRNGIFVDDLLMGRVREILIRHEVVEDKARIAGKNKIEAQSEAMMAEAEMIYNDVILRQAMHIIWKEANRGADVIDKESSTLKFSDAWGKGGEGYTGQGIPKPSSLPAKPSEEGKNKLGGIDFRAMNILVQPMGNFSGLDFTLPKLNNLSSINIDEEFGKIQNMVAGGIIPSGMRIKELIAACSQKKEINSYAEEIIICLADIFKLEEESLTRSSPEIKESLVILDSNRFVLQ